MLDLIKKKFFLLQHPEFDNTDMQPCFCAGGFCLSDNGEDSGKLSFLHVWVCVSVSEHKVRGSLCPLFYCTQASNWARLNCGGSCGRGCCGGVSPWSCVLGTWSQARSWSCPLGRTKLSPLTPDAAHLRLSALQLRPLGSHTLHTPPLRLPSFSSHPTALLTLYSSQRLSICIFWSMGLTRSISTLALASLITASLHGWVFKDNWACEPASLWVTVGWNDNQLDPIQVQSQQGLLDWRQPAGFPVFKKIF